MLYSATNVCVCVRVALGLRKIVTVRPLAATNALLLRLKTGCSKWGRFSFDGYTAQSPKRLHD